jgi:hypothetical protein
MVRSMLRRSYGVNDLRQELDQLEHRFGYDSAEHMCRRYCCGLTPGVPNFEAAVWASTYTDWRRLSGQCLWSRALCSGCSIPL